MYPINIKISNVKKRLNFDLARLRPLHYMLFMEVNLVLYALSAGV